MIDFLKGRKPVIMGIVNVTPDSFFRKEQGVADGRKILEQGAHILDIGGESTRPKSEVIPPEEEIRRVIPVIEGLRDLAPFISVDTRNAKTMQAAIKAGATIINDVSALRHDPESVYVVAESGLPICLMHMQGTPQTMQNNPHYDNVVGEIMTFFEERVEFCLKHGIRKDNIVLDVGIGFGKTVQHNLEILRNLAKFRTLGFPLLLGCSRKSFIAAVSRDVAPQERLAGSLAAALWGMEQGIDIIRVHDVTETVQALAVWNALKES